MCYGMDNIKRRIVSVLVTLILVAMVFPLQAGAVGLNTHHTTIGVNTLVIYVTKDHKVEAFGYTGSGSQGTRVFVAKPTPVADIEDVYAVATDPFGLEFLYAIKLDGTVWELVSNLDLPAPYLEAKPVSGLSDCLKVSVGEAHMLALSSDGSVWSWGENKYGQLGLGHIEDSDIPKKVLGLSNVIDIAAGGTHSLALCADGSVYAWGDNSNGQLGEAIHAGRNYPKQVEGISDVVQITAGDSTSLAVKADASLMSWRCTVPPGHCEMSTALDVL